MRCPLVCLFVYCAFHNRKKTFSLSFFLSLHEIIKESYNISIQQHPGEAEGDPPSPHGTHNNQPIVAAGRGLSVTIYMGSRLASSLFFCIF